MTGDQIQELPENEAFRHAVEAAGWQYRAAMAFGVLAALCLGALFLTVSDLVEERTCPAGDPPVFERPAPERDAKAFANSQRG